MPRLEELCIGALYVANPRRPLRGEPRQRYRRGALRKVREHRDDAAGRDHRQTEFYDLSERQCAARAALTEGEDGSGLATRGQKLALNRSEARRGGKEGVSTDKSRGSQER